MGFPQGEVEAGGGVPERLIRALQQEPQALQAALDRAGLAPHELALWARHTGAGPEIEKLAGWLSVVRRPGHYKPLLEVAASHLRAGEPLEALPVFRWAYQAWHRAHSREAAYRSDGAKLLALWGQCLYRLGYTAEAHERWLWALSLIPDAGTLAGLVRTIEAAGAAQEYRAVVQEARRRDLPGAWDLGQRLRQPTALDADATAPSLMPSPGSRPLPQRGEGSEATTALDEAATKGGPGPSIAVMADVANLDLVCGDQFGLGQRLDYGRLLSAAAELGPVRAQIAFVPDVPETLAVRQHLAGVGFEIDLKRPKRSHGRFVADTDAAMAAAAVRWASDAQVGRVEMWTGDGDLLKVRDVVGEAWPRVTVAFRSFPVGTAASIRQLGDDWLPIGPEYLMP